MSLKLIPEPIQEIPNQKSIRDTHETILNFPRAFKKRNQREKIISAILFFCGIFSVLVTIGIIVSLFSETIGFFRRPEVSFLKFITGTTWRPLATKVSPDNFGILPLVTGTLLIAFISALISVPLGLGSAIFLSEFASERIRDVFKPVLEILAGIPSIVYGYFAISFITPIIKTVFESWFGLEVSFFNALSASIVLGS